MRQSDVIFRLLYSWLGFIRCGEVFSLTTWELLRQAFMPSNGI